METQVKSVTDGESLGFRDSLGYSYSWAKMAGIFNPNVFFLFAPECCGRVYETFFSAVVLYKRFQL